MRYEYDTTYNVRESILNWPTSVKLSILFMVFVLGIGLYFVPVPLILTIGIVLTMVSLIRILEYFILER